MRYPVAHQPAVPGASRPAPQPRWSRRGAEAARQHTPFDTGVHFIDVGLGKPVAVGEDVSV
jgi:hypothetical protein